MILLLCFSVIVVVEAFENDFDSVDTREPKLCLGLRLTFGCFPRKEHSLKIDVVFFFLNHS